jgi:hypothetical protein
MITIATSSAADTALSMDLPKHFVPGFYDLVKGSIDQCGERDFAIENIDKNTFLKLGYYHLFDLSSKSSRMAAETPDENGCTYLYSVDVDNKSDEAVLTVETRLLCKNHFRKTKIEIVHIKENIINLSVNQVGNEPYSYSCQWKRNEKK